LQYARSFDGAAFQNAHFDRHVSGQSLLSGQSLPPKDWAQIIFGLLTEDVLPRREE
jgi:hypothetical protein